MPPSSSVPALLQSMSPSSSVPALLSPHCCTRPRVIPSLTNQLLVVLVGQRQCYQRLQQLGNLGLGCIHKAAGPAGRFLGRTNFGDVEHFW